MAGATDSDKVVVSGSNFLSPIDLHQGALIEQDRVLAAEIDSDSDPLTAVDSDLVVTVIDWLWARCGAVINLDREAAADGDP